ncbi:MAG: hypothetical protein COA58_03745 [Bacteroidetes bacterium]|nr:MAG: hypothetical protein COA58_03745 [Bacteroidota bacterium]
MVIDDHPLWSSDGGKILFNEMGVWKQLDLNEVFLDKADWLNQEIGYNTSEVYDIPEDLMVEKYKAETKYGGREITLLDGDKIELKQRGLRTEFYVRGKLMWRTSGDNCHSLSLSPNNDFVAFISESNGLMLYAFNQKKIIEQIADSVKMCNRAIDYVMGSKLSRARKVLNRLTESNQSYSEPYYWMAMLALSEDQDQKAVDLIDKAIQLDPDFPSHYYLKYALLMNLGKNNEAIHSLEKYIVLKPRSLYGYYDLAELYIKLGDHQKACINFKLAKQYHSTRAADKIEEYCKE